jgi:hypothetical protein
MPLHLNLAIAHLNGTNIPVRGGPSDKGTAKDMMPGRMYDSSARNT